MSDDLPEKVIVIPGQSKVLHTQSTCPNLKLTDKSPRLVDKDVYPNRDVCKVCQGIEIDTRPTFSNTPNRWRDNSPDTCSSCGGNLEDGDCGWCEIYDEVMGVFA